MARLNDTSALTSEPYSEIERTTYSRKIDNGYVVCTSEYNPRTYTCKRTERFSPSAPRVGSDGSVRESYDTTGSAGLGGTKRYLNGDV
jgi:hypothetical protein